MALTQDLLINNLLAELNGLKARVEKLERYGSPVDDSRGRPLIVPDVESGELYELYVRRQAYHDQAQLVMRQITTVGPSEEETAASEEV